MILASVLRLVGAVLGSTIGCGLLVVGVITWLAWLSLGGGNDDVRGWWE